MLNKITVWLKEMLEQSGAKGFVFGLSGGIDSAVVAGLVKRAAGEQHLALIMPCHSDPEDEKYAKKVVKFFDLNAELTDLSPVLDSFLSVLPEGSRVQIGNIKARLRMITLYHYASLKKYLVVGTGNKTEYMLGYFTKFGDGACDIAPLRDFLKRDVRRLAWDLGLPDEIVNRKPSAGLWPEQTDEDELGLSYDVLDNAVVGLEEGSTIISFRDMEKVYNMHKETAHKREPIKYFKKN